MPAGTITTSAVQSCSTLIFFNVATLSIMMHLSSLPVNFYTLIDKKERGKRQERGEWTACTSEIVHTRVRQEEEERRKVAPTKEKKQREKKKKKKRKKI